MNKKGYAVKEMIILCAILGVAFSAVIMQVSFAYQDALNEDEVVAMQNKNLQIAAEAYVELNKDLFQEPETYFFGRELIEKNFLVDIEELGYDTVKFKVTHPEGTDTYTVEIVE